MTAKTFAIAAMCLCVLLVSCGGQESPRPTPRPPIMIEPEESYFNRHTEQLAGWDWESETEQALAVYYKYYYQLWCEPYLSRIEIRPALSSGWTENIDRDDLEADSMAIVMWVWEFVPRHEIPLSRRLPVYIEEVPVLVMEYAYWRENPGIPERIESDRLKQEKICPRQSP